jgi:hypothetical protein
MLRGEGVGMQSGPESTLSEPRDPLAAELSALLITRVGIPTYTA